LARTGERVLGIAIADNIDDKIGISQIKDSKRAKFLGLVTFRDPLRPTVPDAIRRIEGAGVRVIIATGDHPGTAVTIAQEIGWDLQPQQVLVGSDLAGMSDEELLKQLSVVRIIARVAPEEKMRVAKLLRGSGEIVA